ncbi:MAG: hypothetical protein JST85_01755 [Acidobacteria bacterium]|nr:hypothetical protein [Acidobacteriota bacterium]
MARNNPNSLISSGAAHREHVVNEQKNRLLLTRLLVRSRFADPSAMSVEKALTMSTAA